MGGKQSKCNPRDPPEIRRIKEIANADGPGEVKKHLDEVLDKWKNEPVSFGILGKTATGKSTFINAIRGVEYGEPGFAQVGRGNVTTIPTTYCHPSNEQIKFVDLPGFGTLKYPKEGYIEKFKLCEYDYLMLFFDTVLCQDDLWAMHQIMKLEKPFSLVRSKLDKDVELGLKAGVTEEIVIQRLRNKIRTDLEIGGFQYPVPIFLISGKKTRVGEMDELNTHILEKLSLTNEEKYNAVIFSFDPLSKHVIEEKYKFLKKRAIAVTTGTALISAIPVPFIDLGINIGILVGVIHHYINVFGLSRKQMESLQNFDYDQLKCKGILSIKLELKDITSIIGQQLGKVIATVTLVTIQSVLDVFLPIVGSLISSATTAGCVYKLLNGYLDDLRDDAILVYDHITPRD